jgi:hypothetical protein
MDRVRNGPVFFVDFRLLRYKVKTRGQQGYNQISNQKPSSQEALMEDYRRSEREGKTGLVGVDLHRFRWHVTVRTHDKEFSSGTLPGHWELLRWLMDRIDCKRFYTKMKTTENLQSKSGIMW